MKRADLIKRASRSLARLRASRGLSQRALAQHMSISSAAVSNWERGVTLPTVEEVVTMSELYCVPIHEVLGIKPGGE